MQNSVIISNDLDKALQELRQQNSNHVVFESDSLDVESTHEIIRVAYLASEEKKTILIKANTYSEISQNALLKLTEESPPNIEIVFIASSKALFLPTILSRVAIKTLRFELEKNTPNFDYEAMSKANLLEFIKKNRYLSAAQVSELIDGALFWVKNKGFVDKIFLDFLYRAKRLLKLNSNPSNIAVDLFLHVIRIKNRQKN